MVANPQQTPSAPDAPNSPIVPSPPSPPPPTSTPVISVPSSLPTVSTPIVPSLDTASLPSATPSATSTVKASSGSKGLKGGAVAGIAIGMLLAGFLLAGIIFFFLLRRQKSKQRGSSSVTHSPPVTYVARPQKALEGGTSTVSNSIDNYLPQPVSDETITDEVSKIRDNIKNHVRTFYHTEPVTSEINEAALGNIAATAGIHSAKLVGALANPSTRHEVLRLVVAWVIMSKTTGPRNARLLPPDLFGLTSAITGSESTAAGSALYSKWKTITGALLQKQFEKNAKDPSRAQTFANVLAELDAIVGPFVKGGVDRGQRGKNLDMILGRAANLAFLLFTQPGSFYFDFVSPRGGLAVFPTFVQTVNDQGQTLSTARVLLEGEFVAA